jgi:bifunctional aspartokinase / homoserine dehydrogenase 1
MKDTLVMKFGGTSVGSAEAIQQVIEIARSANDDWRNVAIIVSAMSGVTDKLLNGAKSAAAGDGGVAGKIASKLLKKHMDALDELAPNASQERKLIETLLEEFVSLCHAIHVLGEASPRALDAISSLGERMSTPLVAAVLNQAGIPACAVDTREVLVTDDVYQFASPDMEATGKRAEQVIKPIFEAGNIPVITGFIGASREKAVTTLGRGGSDFSGAIFGVILEAQEIWIWTDVSGVMSTDPHIEPSARTLPEVTYKEISELAFYGAKVLHPKTIRPALEHGITLWVKNTFVPESTSTRIIKDGNRQKGHIRAVTAIRGQCLITVEGRGMLGVPGIAARMFTAVARSKTSIVMISQASSEQSICFVVPYTAREVVTQALEEEFRYELNRRDIDRISASEDCAIVTVVGAGMRSTPGIAGKVFSAVGAESVNVIAIAQGSSECSISLVVDALEADMAIRAIHGLIVK